MLKRFSPHRENHSVVIATICDKVCICFQDCDCSSVYVAFEFHAHFNFHCFSFRSAGTCVPFVCDYIIQDKYEHKYTDFVNEV